MNSQKKKLSKMKDNSETLMSMYEQIGEDTETLIEYFHTKIERDIHKSSAHQNSINSNRTMTNPPDLDVTNNYKDNLLASLYSQLEFLRNEIVEKNEVIRKCFHEGRSKDSVDDYRDKYQENLTASLYAQIAFLRKELDEKNVIIKILLRNASLQHMPDPTLSIAPVNSLPIEDLNILSDDSGVAHSDAASSASTICDASEDGHLDDGLFDVYDNKFREPTRKNIEVPSTHNDNSVDKEIDTFYPYSTTTTNTCTDQSLTWQPLNSIWESDLSLVETKEEVWESGTHLIIGDDTILGVDEKQFGSRVKVRGYTGARLDNFYDYLKPLVAKCPSYVTIMTCSDDLKEKSGMQIVNQLLGLKSFVEQKVPGCRVKVSCAKSRFDDDRTKLLTLELRQLLENLNILQ